MTAEQVSRAIKLAAVESGFDRCGIALAGPIAHCDFFTKWLSLGYAGSMAYLHRHNNSRQDLRNWLPWARSVVVAAMNYHQSDPPLRPNAAAESAVICRERGRVASYAWGEDYHRLVSRRLATLLARMQAILAQPFQARLCVDTSAIIERELASAAGVGWIGKNTMVLHESLGSFFFLGEIITDLDIPPDQPAADRCGTCTRCLDACPTGAFPQPHVMDARRCISYLTIEHRGEIPEELTRRMGNRVFGCDACQTACPFNRRAPDTNEPGLRGSPDCARPALEEILSWDQAAYRARVKGKAWRRATMEMWQRNARLAQANALTSHFSPSAGVDPPPE